MLTLNQLSGHDALVAILDSKKLSERFENWIHTCEMDDYIGDKLREFTPRAAEWSVGTYSPSYISVRDSRLFLDCVQNSISFYGGSNRLEKLAKQCDKLRDSNLFDYMVEKLCEVYFDDEIQPTIDYVEDCGYAIYCKDAIDYELERRAESERKTREAILKAHLAKRKAQIKSHAPFYVRTAFAV